MPTYGPVEIRRRVPYPMDPAYRWLTDFDEFDHQRSSGFLRGRRVLDAPKGLARIEDRVRLLGEDRTLTQEVDLQPPDRWVARVVEGDWAGTEAVHELAAAPDRGSLLVVKYTFSVGLLGRLRLAVGAGDDLEAELVDAWDGVVAAMEDELGPVEGG
jgi:hypothetical protein